MPAKPAPNAEPAADKPRAAAIPINARFIIISPFLFI
jgi:hypothetical protein